MLVRKTMKYQVLLLPLLTAAVLAATSESRFPVSEPRLAETAALAATPNAGHDVEHTPHDPHAALHGSHADPHHGLYGGDPDPHAGAHADTRAPGLPTPLERSSAANARTVAEIFLERAALNEQPVRLRATVVKLTEGIMGKTYLHLQDGSGSAERGNHDLTATTTEPFEVGETVEVKGQLAIDQDVGVGYRYAALLTELIRVHAD
jgi:hypothetical protein